MLHLCPDALLKHGRVQESPCTFDCQHMDITNNACMRALAAFARQRPALMHHACPELLPRHSQSVLHPRSQVTCSVRATSSILLGFLNRLATARFWLARPLPMNFCSLETCVHTCFVHRGGRAQRAASAEQRGQRERALSWSSWGTGHEAAKQARDQRVVGTPCQVKNLLLQRKNAHTRVWTTPALHIFLKQNESMQIMGT